MALLTYTHSKTKKISYLYPMILLYTAWGVTETAQVLLMFVPRQYSGESLVPYMMGGIVSLLSLVFVIKWSDSDSAWASKTNPRYWPLIGVLSQVFLLIVGLRIEALLGHGMPFLTNSPLGRSGLLVVNLFVMFEFAYVFAYMMKRDGTAFTSEIVMVGFFALWVVPGLLKSNYPDWSAGWWTSEVLLLLALMLGPVILGVMYLKELNRAESEHRRARVFSDLLVHDVSNYHQAILLSLDLLKVGLRDELRSKVVHEARGELNRADHLIRNVRQLALSQALGRASIGPVDLVECIQSAFESACPPPEQGGVHFSTSHEAGQVYVLANALLEGVFVNLFRNSLRYSKTEKHIDVHIEEVTIDGDEYAEVHVEDRGYGIPPDRKKKLFDRFMAGAEGTGLGLSVVKTLTESFGGQVQVQDRIEGDHTQGTHFTIRLPMADKPLEIVHEAT
ncbi:HAMP domain-containing histidine kinase [Candidatus Thorarchaeota archaeon]|nr:MAG: HAMP domain-containing histidine kinase [Candidatus Thorarchaeota archaeon]